MSFLRGFSEIFTPRFNHIKVQEKIRSQDDLSKVSFLFEVIKRYDNYIISTNTKASLIITFNGIILGTSLLNFKNIIGFYSSPAYQRFSEILLLGIILFSLFSLLFVFNVVYPFLGNSTDDKFQKNSLIFFGSVSNMDKQKYNDYIKRASRDDLINDLSIQATILANGLNSKMKSMRRSIAMISIVLGLIIGLVLMKTSC